jgi:hypothetical protein
VRLLLLLLALRLRAHTDVLCSTVLDREPKVGSRPIELLRLWKRVNEEGGYDKVSDIKGNKLAWRRIASEFLPNGPSLTTQAFLVKSTYYKNLAYAPIRSMLVAW